MTLVGVLGLLLGLLAGTFAFVRRTRMNITMFALCYLMHIVASVLYFRLVEAGGGDARFYFEDPLDMYGDGFGFNTSFIIYLVQLPKAYLGGTMLDYFLVFQAIGFWGIALLMRIFEEIHLEAGAKHRSYAYLILFLPSLHYWTAAIGKDGLYFFAICLAIFASMRFRSRIALLVLAMAIMVMIRSYVAVISLAAFVVTVLVDRKMHVALRVLLFTVGLAGTGYAVADLWTTFRFDVTDVDAISGMLASRDTSSLDAAVAGNSAVGGSYPLRILSLLFRPFFLDSPGALGLVVSLENVLQMMATLWFFFHFRTSWLVMRGVHFARYAMVSSIGITLGLAIGYYNVGLGIRQEATMILPGFLVSFVAVLTVVGARRSKGSGAIGREEPGGPLHPTIRRPG
jgi:hypothetical protein